MLQDWQAGRLTVIAATVAFGMGVDKAGKWEGLQPPCHAMLCHAVFCHATLVPHALPCPALNNRPFHLPCADVRTVIHYSLPKSLSGFYQEAGRCALVRWHES